MTYATVFAYVLSYGLCTHGMCFLMQTKNATPVNSHVSAHLSCPYAKAICAIPWHSFCHGFWDILTLVRQKKNTGLIAKCMVRHKKALFDTKMPSWHCHYQPPHPALLWEIFFFQFYSNILFLRTNWVMKMKLYWYEFPISIFNII